MASRGNTYRMHVAEGVGTTHSLGLQLKVHKSLFAAMGPVTVVSPRIMCLNLKMHAPHFGTEDDNIHDQFYRELGETVRQVLPSWVDANLGDSGSPGVGSLGTRLRALSLTMFRFPPGEHHEVRNIALSTQQFR